MNLDLRTYSTFNIGGIAHKVFEINNIQDIEKINSYALYVDKPLVIIGEGSNSIFADTTNKYVIGLMKIKGIKIINQFEHEVSVQAFGGEKWDELVAWCVEHNLVGIEPLSGIPGTAGAAPIQNIGAYGSEISQVFVEAYVFDRITKTFITLSNEQCDFSYRDSIFKKNPEKYIIVNITIKLSFDIQPLIPNYKDIQEIFINKKPIGLEIRDAIIKTRNKKIPDYKNYPNCGSFFKNPIIEKNHLNNIQEKYPAIPFFETSDSKIKLYAGWLIENVDYKTAQNDKIIFNESNKLILVNKDNGDFNDLKFVLSNIKKLVKDAYDISLEVEPNIFE